MDDCSNDRVFRPVFIFGLPILLLVCVAAIVWIVLATENALLCLPVVFVAFGTMRQMRWTMIWLSDPAEKKMLGQNLEREPALHQILAFVREKTGKT